ncbi:MAG TPA: GDSL-type esterase/lipase family protein [Thermomonas sp.]|nr:GDSL-type esterase/lipase family protein [Thermomonas sp.]
MKARLLPLALLVLGCVSAAPSHAQAVAAPSALPAPAIVDASAPIARTGKPSFYTLHDEFLARGKSGPIGVLFLGDSITERWKQAPHIWEHYFGKYQPANFGIGGDRTHHVIWRIENGELDGIKPKVVVLMLGTNNTDVHSAEQIAAADEKIIGMIRKKIPGAKVLLLAIFPRDARKNTDGLIIEANVADAAKRNEIIDKANALLAKLDDGKQVRFLNINHVFLGRDGRIPWTIMPDQLHLSPAGYQLWAEAIDKQLAEMME